MWYFGSCYLIGTSEGVLGIMWRGPVFRYNWTREVLEIWFHLRVITGVYGPEFWTWSHYMHVLQCNCNFWILTAQKSSVQLITECVLFWLTMWLRMMWPCEIRRVMYSVTCAMNASVMQIRSRGLDTIVCCRSSYCAILTCNKYFRDLRNADSGIRVLVITISLHMIFMQTRYWMEQN